MNHIISKENIPFALLLTFSFLFLFSGVGACLPAGREAAALYWVGNEENGRGMNEELNGLEDHFFSGVTERHVETFKKIFSPDQAESNPETRRKTQDSFEFDGTDFDWQAMDVGWNLTSVANSYQNFVSVSQINSKTDGILSAENTEASAGIDKTPYITPPVSASDLDGDDGSGKLSVQEAVFENYRAQTKSSGLGMRRPVGMTPGCLRLASCSKRAGSKPMNSSPSATIAYFPAYLSTNILKCLRTHSWSSIFLPFTFFLRAFITNEVYHDTRSLVKG